MFEIKNAMEEKMNATIVIRKHEKNNIGRN